MKEIDYVESVQESVEEEFKSFKQRELKKTKEEIFSDYYEIHFYDEVSNFLMGVDDAVLDEIHWKCLNKDKGNILKLMYDYYLKSEFASINNSEDLMDLVVDYNRKYHHNILYKEAEAE